MDTITIICSVAAEFKNSEGEVYHVTRRELNLIKTAPAWIKDTLMFKLLAADGSLKAVTSANRVQAENNPTAGMGADGKAIQAESKAPRRPRKQKTEAEKADVPEEEAKADAPEEEAKADAE